MNPQDNLLRSSWSALRLVFTDGDAETLVTWSAAEPPPEGALRWLAQVALRTRSEAERVELIGPSGRATSRWTR